jgi:hypothetical protein
VRYDDFTAVPGGLSGHHGGQEGHEGRGGGGEERAGPAVGGLWFQPGQQHQAGGEGSGRRIRLT